MLKKIFKIGLIIFAVLLILLVSIYAYYRHQENVKKKQELEFDTKVNWTWENEYNHVQITYHEEEKVSVLRKVNLEEKYAVYLLKNDDYTFSTFVKFTSDCKPGTKIETTEKFSNGESKTLVCSEDGKSLGFEVYWNQKEPITSWNENLNGFKVNESFYGWNFDRLDREITLKKAK